MNVDMELENAVRKIINRIDSISNPEEREQYRKGVIDEIEWAQGMIREAVEKNLDRPQLEKYILAEMKAHSIYLKNMEDPI